MAEPAFPKLYVAWAEWGACLLFLVLQSCPLNKVRTGFLAAGALAVGIVYQVLSERLPLEFWLLGMAGGAGLMFAFLFWAAPRSAVSVGYTTALAFATAEFTESIEWQFHAVLFDGASPLDPGPLLFCLAVYAGVLTLIGGVVSRHTDQDSPLQITARQMGSVVLTTLTAFLISNLSFLTTDTPFSARLAREVFYIRTLVDLSALLILFALHEQHSRAQIRHELKAIQEVLHRQYEHYRLSKESIDMLNRKHHDLKHQIALIRSETNQDSRDRYIDALEQDLGVFEGQRETGNAVLDTILGGKAMLCGQYGVTLTCVADGGLLTFMDVMDICTIFGNALDNAIESARLVKYPERRIVKVAVYRQNDFLMIRVENYFENELRYEKGVLVTTKGDPAYHGYGIKSLRYSAQRYNGSLTISTRDQWFTLCLLIPFSR